MGHLRRPKLSHLWDIDKHLSNYSLLCLFMYMYWKLELHLNFDVTKNIHGKEHQLMSTESVIIRSMLPEESLVIMSGSHTAFPLCVQYDEP